ncbi:TPA: DUF2971 domain-containing protein [Acinetobacter baumannii]|nr:DUF2971 domain-containing protein [Acinetobacter baumannii]
MNSDLRQIVEDIFGKTASADNIVANKARLNKLLPNYIYKYRSLNDNAVKNVLSRTLWFDTLLQMNDPYEGRHTYNHPLKTPLKEMPDFLKYLLHNNHDIIDKGQYENILENNLTLENILKLNLPDNTNLSHMIAAFDHIHENEKQKFHENFLKQIFICSFSEKYDSVLMWAHYSNNHSGFCIEYDLSKVPVMNHFRNFLYPVIYDSELFDISDLIAQKNDENEYSNLYMLQAIIRKSPDWAYEHEWRVIHPFGTLTKAQCLPTPKPSAILLGSNFFKELNKSSVSLALELTEYCEKEQIPVQMTKNSFQKYQLVRESISYSEIYKRLNSV